MMTAAVDGSAVRLQAEDALFLYAQTPMLCQQVGAVLLLEPKPIRTGDFQTAVRERAKRVPELCRRLEQPQHSWQRPRWVADDTANFAARIGEVTVGAPGAPDTLRGAVNSFFSAPCDPFGCPWQIQVIRGDADHPLAVVVKVHHTVGDSDAIIATLSNLFDAAAVPGHSHHQPPQRARTLGERAGGAVRAIRGLCHLAAAGTAPKVGVCGPFTSAQRRYVPVALPAREVAATARGLNAGITELLLSVITEALTRLLRSRGEQTAGRRVRIAVPRTQPASTVRRGPSPGNRSAALSLDVPLGPLSLAGRLDAIRGQARVHLRRGEAAASALVLRAMNLLPPPVARRFAGQIYRRRWFNLLVSVFPGVRRSHRLLGARVRAVYPVLALADGVGLAIGAMTWERSLSVGLLADAALVPDVDRLASGIAVAFREYQAAAGLARVQP